MTRLAGLYEGMREWDKAVDAWQRALGLPNLPPDEKLGGTPSAGRNLQAYA